MLDVLRKIFGSKHEKDVQQLLPIVEEINRHFESYKSLSDDELRAKTGEFKKRIVDETTEINAHLEELHERLKTEIPFEEREKVYDEIDDGEKELHETIKEILDEILPEAFAVVKDTCRRLVGEVWDVAGNKVSWDMVPFDVQLIGGIVLHQGKIAEMATGEGKTLVATLPMYLNALAGKGVHLVTVNDYLALRDSQWMGKIFEFHGLKVGCILQNQDPPQRRVQYAADIMYGTNNEFGFDYLRDNMVGTPDDMVQRGHYYAIVDEVDSVLVDEARTPLIISGPVEVDDQKFGEMKPRVERIVAAQRNLVAKIVSDAETMLQDEKKRDEAGILLLRANRGAPKNKKLIKIFSDGASKKLMQETESIYLAEQSKRMHEIDDELYFAIDEKNHSIDLTEKGRELLAGSTDKDFFVIPDIGTEMSLVENNHEMGVEQKQAKKDEINKLYAERSDRIHTVLQLLKAYSVV